VDNAHMPEAILIQGSPGQRSTRLDIDQLPGAVTLIGEPGRGGYAYAGQFAHRWDAIADLLRRGLAITARSFESRA
jgi:hypothetical protein